MSQPAESSSGRAGPTGGPAADLRIVVVAGLPRSGTTALFDALSSAPGTVARHEPSSPEIADPLYDSVLLRREAEMRPHLETLGGVLLLRGNEELRHRSLDDLIEDLAPYDPTVVWIYRDAARTIGSAVARGWITSAQDVERALSTWEAWHRSVLETRSDRLAVVAYADLGADPSVLERLGARIGLEPRVGVGADVGRGLQHLTNAQIAEITDRTGELLAALDDRRTVVARDGAARSGPERSGRPDAGEVVTGVDRPFGLGGAGSAAPRDGRVHLLAGDLDLGPVEPWEPHDGRSCPVVTVGDVRCEVGPAGHHVVRAAGGRVEVDPTGDWGRWVDGEWTLVVRFCPPEDPLPWSPIATVGDPVGGHAGMSVVWLGTDTDGRLRAADGTWVARPPGTSLVLCGLLGEAGGPRSSSVDAAPSVALPVAADGAPIVVAARHRVVDGRGELLLVVEDRARSARTVLPTPPREPVGGRGLRLLGHPERLDAQASVGLVEVVAVDRALADRELDAARATVRGT